MTIAILDPHAIAASARDKVTAWQLDVLRYAAELPCRPIGDEGPDGVICTPHTRTAIAYLAAHELVTPGAREDEWVATEAGRCLLAMVAAAEPAPAPSEPVRGVQLSVEECVYWLIVVDEVMEHCLGTDEAVACIGRDTKTLEASIELYAEMRKGWAPLRQREYAVAVWLCRQAIAAIGRERSSGV